MLREDIMAIVSAVFFQLFPIIRNIWPHLSSFTIIILVECVTLWGERERVHL